jgi:hypothetical protein
MTPDEIRPENTVQENRAIEAGLEELKADGSGPGEHDPDEDPPVDVQTE